MKITTKLLQTELDSLTSDQRSELLSAIERGLWQTQSASKPATVQDWLFARALACSDSSTERSKAAEFLSDQALPEDRWLLLKLSRDHWVVGSSAVEGLSKYSDSTCRKRVTTMALRDQHPINRRCALDSIFANWIEADVLPILHHAALHEGHPMVTPSIGFGLLKFKQPNALDYLLESLKGDPEELQGAYPYYCKNVLTTVLDLGLATRQEVDEPYVRLTEIIEKRQHGSNASPSSKQS